MNEGTWSAVRTLLTLAAGAYAGNNAALHTSLMGMISDLGVILPAAVSLASAGIGIYKNWNTVKVPASSVAAKMIVACLTLTLFGPQLYAADNLPVKASPIAAPATCTTAACSGPYATFGLDWNAALSSTLTGSNPNNGIGLNVGGGYNFWQNQTLAGLEGTLGYEGGTAGSVGTLTGTAFGKIGYNFLPSTQTAPATPSQNPFAAFVPANLLANATPAIIGGLSYSHGQAKAAVGAEVDTVIASQSSLAVQLYNAPSQKGQPDETVARIMYQYHFKGL